VIGRVVVICLAAFLVGGVGLYGASRRQEPAVRRARLIKFITYFLIVNVVVLSALAGRGILSGLIAVVALAGARELYRVLPQASGERLAVEWALSIFYLSIAAGAVMFTWLSPPGMTVFVYLVVCAFDGFSQVTGQLLGKHRLAPRISPGKTIEGSVGGLLFAIGMALVLLPVVGLSVLRDVISGCFIVAAALSGDLLASWVKRKGKVKDFGTLLPGHGGVLDRFDSFLFAAAACLLAANLCGRMSH